MPDRSVQLEGAHNHHFRGSTTGPWPPTERYLIIMILNEQTYISIEEYLRLNHSFGQPILYSLTERGLFSEVLCLLNAVLFCAVTKRRLVVNEEKFNGLSWMDLFGVALPTEDDQGGARRRSTTNEGQSQQLDAVRAWAADQWRQRAILKIEPLSLQGDFFQLIRTLSSILCPAPCERHRAEREMATEGLKKGQFAALHVRRGDKVRRWRARPEGEATAPGVYVDAIHLHRPDIRDVFILTDDFRVVEDFAASSSEFRFVTLCPPTEIGHRQRTFNALPTAEKREEISRLLTEVHIAAASGLFVGGFKSNVALYIAAVHSDPANCFSVDGQLEWNPG